MTETDPGRGRDAAAHGTHRLCRQLVYALFGVAFEMPLRALCDTLALKCAAARAAGCPAAGDLVAHAHAVLTRAVGSPDGRVAMNREPKGDALAAPLRTVIEHVRRAGALLAPAAPVAARLYTTAPDPGAVRDGATLREQLHLMIAYTGATRYALTAHRDLGVVTVNAVLDSGFVPSDGTLRAWLEVCAVPPASHPAWLEAVKALRVAHARRESGRTRSGWRLPQDRPPVRATPRRAIAPAPAPGGPPPAPRRPDIAPPGPEGAHGAEALRARLAALHAWSGRTLAQVHAVAAEAGKPTKPETISAVLRPRVAVPHERVLCAFLAGCGLAEDEFEPWLAARREIDLACRRAARARTPG